MLSQPQYRREFHSLEHITHLLCPQYREIRENLLYQGRGKELRRISSFGDRHYKISGTSQWGEGLVWWGSTGTQAMLYN